MDAKPSNTIGDLKNKLVQFTGLDPQVQTLVGVDGNPLGAEGKTLAECLLPIGGTVYLKVHPYDTVSLLEARLQPLLGTDDAAAAIRLYHNGEELGAKPGEDDALPLSEFGMDPVQHGVL
jgi:hypothetical protein